MTSGDNDVSIRSHDHNDADQDHRCAGFGISGSNMLAELGCAKVHGSDEDPWQFGLDPWGGAGGSFGGGENGGGSGGGKVDVARPESADRTTVTAHEMRSMFRLFEQRIIEGIESRLECHRLATNTKSAKKVQNIVEPSSELDTNTDFNTAVGAKVWVKAKIYRWLPDKGFGFARCQGKDIN